MSRGIVECAALDAGSLWIRGRIDPSEAASRSSRGRDGYKVLVAARGNEKQLLNRRSARYKEHVYQCRYSTRWGSLAWRKV